MAKKPAVKQPRNRAAQDTTFINLRPVQKQLRLLQDRVSRLEQQLRQILGQQA